MCTTSLCAPICSMIAILAAILSAATPWYVVFWAKDESIYGGTVVLQHWYQVYQYNGGLSNWQEQDRSIYETAVDNASNNTFNWRNDWNQPEDMMTMFDTSLALTIVSGVLLIIITVLYCAGNVTRCIPIVGGFTMRTTRTVAMLFSLACIICLFVAILLFISISDSYRKYPEPEAFCQALWGVDSKYGPCVEWQGYDSTDSYWGPGPGWCFAVICLGCTVIALTLAVWDFGFHSILEPI